ncbi:TLR adapter interacting with SLC15A4 on the lysosome [Trichosurus vulpecula]|uniref:TLR adapter interacting with SLC15A4 on the lysosome n=1 Tax=Trichosurus vulpecula TaxID=9337 RepID=UPI00186ADD0F|nr:TLR adapter interacting with SLC15A4 on the lysosome [Trichosurus vulpecula]XP_036598877.1 TLR adapter interacting with SLC15A4 on the lysosome [Trichosurus vulpecula]
MLSEAYLLGIAYWSDNHLTCPPSDEQVAEEKAMEMNSNISIPCSSADEAQDTSLRWRCKPPGSFISSISSRENQPSRKQKVTVLESSHSPLLEWQTSAGVEDCGDPNVGRETYLVPPSCKSICKNYNDLHIAGGQVMAINLAATDSTLESSFEFGPLLKSSEIPLPMEESISTQLSDLPCKPLQRHSSYWRITSIKDKSIMPLQKPLSNAMLNEYLEQKVMELYKQYFMDTVFHDNSPIQILGSELMTSVDQISLQISREKNLEAVKAKDMVINCLLRLVSTEISTPSLHISQYSNVSS